LPIDFAKLEALERIRQQQASSQEPLIATQEPLQAVESVPSERRKLLASEIAAGKQRLKLHPPDPLSSWIVELQICRQLRETMHEQQRALDERLYEAIREGKRQGLSVRAIGELVGMSGQGVNDVQARMERRHRSAAAFRRHAR
jgi:hypothetical protein